jgi:hypothetical protein
MLTVKGGVAERETRVHRLNLVGRVILADLFIAAYSIGMDNPTITARRFRCKHCGTTGPVHSDLPEDYKPNICDSCHEYNQTQFKLKFSVVLVGLAILAESIKRT